MTDCRKGKNKNKNNNQNAMTYCTREQVLYLDNNEEKVY